MKQPAINQNPTPYPKSHLKRRSLRLATTCAGVLIILTIAGFSPCRSAAQRGGAMQITSQAFQNGGDIPRKFTCQGDDGSPELTWQGAPAGTKTFALIVHDPDAPRAGGWTHWVVFNVPASVTHAAENAPKTAQFPGGGVQGHNDWGKAGYGGPCPPSGTHRYFFRVYALDTELKLPAAAGKDEVEKAMQRHVLGQAELMGKYKKS
jgi:Raf kinase inhibitor-like YbhB/YbcL family protein